MKAVILKMKRKWFLISLICFILFVRMTEKQGKEVKKDNSKTYNSSPSCKDIYLQQNPPKRNQMVSEIDLEYFYDYKKLLKCFNLDESRFFNLPFVSYIVLKKWIFQGFANHIYSNKDQIIIPNSVNCGDIIYINSKYIKYFIKYYHKKIKQSYILISHQSDASVGYPMHLDFLNGPKIIKWFSQNVIAKHPKLEPIPIGVVPPIDQNFSVLHNTAKNLIPFHNRSVLLYLNFSPQTNENRSIIKNYFKNSFKNNSKVVINEDWLDWSVYLSHLGNTKFVLSPPGNGIDTHRTWEALSMGAVPIVLNQSEFQSLFDDLPVMVVNDWTEVTEANMEKFISQRQVNNFSKDGIPWRPKLWLRYWIVKIMSEKYNYIKQFC